jgi:hypothetical protein
VPCEWVSGRGRGGKRQGCFVAGKSTYNENQLSVQSAVEGTRLKLLQQYPHGASKFGLSARKKGPKSLYARARARAREREIERVREREREERENETGSGREGVSEAASWAARRATGTPDKPCLATARG